MRRVVITGMGLVTPLANGREASWKKLIAGESGLKSVDLFDTSDLACKIGGQVPWVSGRGGGKADDPGSFNPEKTMSPKEQRRVDEFILYAMAAADEAIEDSGWKPESYEDKIRTGVLIGSGIGGLKAIADTAVELHEKGPRRVSPFFIPSALINLASGQVSIKYGFKGPNHAVVTACATGAHAIGDAMRLIQWGDADVMVAGGAEASICRIGYAGFIACRAMSTGFNETPEKASRPYDKDRDGFVMGEGAGIVVLEEYEHAKKRGAKIYAEVVGYGLTGDAFHITSPDETGDGGERAMRTALQRVGPRCLRDRLCQRSRHLDAGGRRDRGARRGAGARRCRGDNAPVLDQVGHRPPAGRGRLGRGDLLRPGDPRRRDPADAEPRQPLVRKPHQPDASQGGEEEGAGGVVQLVRIWRNERRAGDEGGWTDGVRSRIG